MIKEENRNMNYPEEDKIAENENPEPLKVVKWTFWGDPEYPEAAWTNETEDRLYEEAVVRAVKEHGYRFTGTEHQRAEYGTPVLNDGKQYNVSMRHWGRIMAEVLGLTGEYDYAIWAWWGSDEQGSIMPDPTEWGEEDLETHTERWQQHERELWEEELRGWKE